MIARSPFEIAADILDPPPNPYLDDPVGWGEEKLGRVYWSIQKQIMESVRDNRRTAVRSSHGIGKSLIAADVVSWWLDSHPPGEAFAVTSAPVHQQVQGVLWRYIGQNHHNGELIGRVNQTEWLIGNELIGFGRSPAKPAEGGGAETITAFQGIHAKYVLVVLDEACGLSGPLWAAAKSLITGRHNRILAIGNPDDPTSEFEKVCREGSGWNVLGISTFDTPNFTGEWMPDDILQVLPDQQWLDEYKADYGEGTAMWVAKVLGQFPKDASDAVVPYTWAYKCKNLGYERDPRHIMCFGADIGGGTDETVVTPRQGRAFLPQVAFRNEDPMETADEIVKVIEEYRPQVLAPVDGITCRMNIEADGLGWGVAGRVGQIMFERGWADVEVNAVKVGSASSDPMKYSNLRSELYWMAREYLHQRVYDITLLDDDEKCLNEITFPKWHKTSTGLIEVEKRESIVRRLKHSPDRASSFILTTYVPFYEHSM